jgi:phosphoribosyl-AMP cyclohydrolase
MRTKVGTFQHEVTVVSADGQAERSFDAWVDTGAHFSQFPASVLEALGYRPNATRRFRLADGQVTEGAVGPITLRLGDEAQPVVCLFAEEGADALLGATSLEIFTVAADPVNKTLVPVEAMRLAVLPTDSLEEGTSLALDFDKLAKVAEVPGVVPCAVQNVDTGEVILVAYVNELALRTAVETRSAVFWSTSRNELWEKGKTSGESFDLIEVRVNCEQNSLLYVVRPRHGGICHTQNQAGAPRNCFYRRLDFENWQLENLDP